MAIKVIQSAKSGVVLRVEWGDLAKVGVRSPYGSSITRNSSNDKDIERCIDGAFSRHRDAARLVVEHFGKLRLTRDVLERIDRLLAAGREMVDGGSEEAEDGE